MAMNTETENAGTENPGERDEIEMLLPWYATGKPEKTWFWRPTCRPLIGRMINRVIRLD
jgi:hypothetical protein